MSDESNPARLLGRLRWANVSEVERRAHALKMLEARWGKRRKRLHRRAKARARG